MLVGFYQTLLLVLALSGATKIINPDQAGRALVSARMVPGPLNRRYRLSRLEAQLLGLAEVILAVGGIGSSRSGDLSAFFAVAVAAMFVGFNLFIGRLMTIDPGAGCGCFGESSAPPGPMHKAFNYVAAVIATMVAVMVSATGNLPLPPTVSAQAWSWLVPYGATLIIGAALFLRGPSLIGELKNAISQDVHDHNHATTFSIDHSALTPSATARPKRTARKSL